MFKCLKTDALVELVQSIGYSRFPNFAKDKVTAPATSNEMKNRIHLACCLLVTSKLVKKNSKNVFGS